MRRSRNELHYSFGRILKSPSNYDNAHVGAWMPPNSRLAPEVVFAVSAGDGLALDSETFSARKGGPWDQCGCKSVETALRIVFVSEMRQTYVRKRF